MKEVAETNKKSTTAALVSMKDLVLSYRAPGNNDFTAVSELNWLIKEGQFSTLVGPSGCGKSTILKAIAGLLLPTSGELQVNLPSKRSPADISIAFQSPTLLPWLTVKENALLPFSISGQKISSDILARLDACLNMVGLSDYSSALPRELSGGMAMRAALVRAFIPKSRLILLDEPFAALDEWTRDRLCDELEKLWRFAGNTIVFVTHNLAEAVQLSDNIALLSANPGRIVASFDIPFERPRRHSIRLESGFTKILEDIRTSLSHFANDSLQRGNGGQ